MKLLENILIKNETVLKMKKSKRVVCDGIMQQALLVAASFFREKEKILVVLPNAYQAQQFGATLSSLIGEDNTILFNVDESLRIESIASSPEMEAQRIFILASLLEDKPLVLVTYTQGILRELPTKKMFEENFLNLKVGQEIDLNYLTHKLRRLGYKKNLKVEQSLEYAYRGSIVDVFSINYNNPIRIEFFGDEIESIRFFDATEQKTIELVDSISILPASELVLDDSLIEQGIEKINDRLLKQTKLLPSMEEKEKLINNVNNHIESIKNYEYNNIFYRYYDLLNPDSVSIIEFFNPDVSFICSYEGIKTNYNLVLDENTNFMLEQSEELDFLSNLSVNLDLSYVLSKANNKIYLNDVKEDSKDLEFSVREVTTSNGNAKLFSALVTRYILEDNDIYICLSNENQIENVKLWLAENLLDKEKKIHFIKEDLNEGFELLEEKKVFLTQNELFNTKKKTTKLYNRFKSAVALSSVSELNPYDYVVHEEHGIGQYIGIKTMKIDDIHRDYLHIVYRGNSNLYVPLEQFKLVKKYVGQEGKTPKLNSMNSTEWQKTKERIKKRVSDIADRLLELYQERTKSIGFAFSSEDELERSFDNDFPYTLTSDQEKTMREVKSDMEKPYPMDRLVCGDVGFGKTEIAFRAAFKAIKDGKQVAMICPTTILARQHYYKALERFQNFSVRIELVSRLVSAQKQNKIIEDLKKGNVNFIIGTHRLLSSDFKFKDLGLLIVDEEQRFGVEHKEKIKEMKNNVDVLTLSATPIPRTLQMALVGIRGMSQIQTPPNDRLPVQTYIIERNDKVIKEIIERELGRGGQVFFLHNKTSDIYGLASKLSKDIPNAKVGVGHGKMNREELEDIMLSFYNNEINVLLCTTIIESGIDIPNANTVIIDDADCFGLSQLYQIKGRVGRSDRIAYAYLMYRPKKQLSEIASKRLKAIKEFTELGSGYKIALRDLSIRGAGDILGAEQAGFIDDVGIDMYMALLDETIKEKKMDKNEKKKIVKAPPVMQLDSYVPIEFASEDANKFEIYKDIEKVKTLDELYELESKIKDNYGNIIRPVSLLLEKKKIDLLSTEDCFDNINENKDYIDVFLSESFSKINGIGIDLFDLVNNIDSVNINLIFRQEKIRVRILKKDDWSKNLSAILDKIDKLNKKKKN